MKFIIRGREEKITFSVGDKWYVYLRIDSAETIYCDGETIYSDNHSILTDEGREIRQQLYVQQIVKIPTY